MKAAQERIFGPSEDDEEKNFATGQAIEWPSEEEMDKFTYQTVDVNTDFFIGSGTAGGNHHGRRLWSNRAPFGSCRHAFSRAFAVPWVA